MKNVLSLAAILISSVSGQYGAGPSPYSSRPVMGGNGFGNGGMAMRPQYAPAGPAQGNWGMPSSAGASYVMLQRPTYSAPSQILSPVMQQQTFVNTGPVSPFASSPAVAQQYAAPSSGYSGQQQSVGPVGSAWSAPAPLDQQQAPAPSSVWSSPVANQGPATYGEQMGQLPLANTVQQSAPTYSGPAASLGQQQQSYNGPAAQQFSPANAGPSASLGQQQQSYNGPAAPAFAGPSTGSQSYNGPAAQLASADLSAQQAAPSYAPQSLGSNGPSAYNGAAQVGSSSQQFAPAQQQSYSADAAQPQAAFNPAAGQQFSGPTAAVSPVQQQQQWAAPAAQQQFSAPASASSGYDPSTGSSYASMRTRGR